VFFVVYFRAESWTLAETIQKELEAFEMWLYRRILRISWVGWIFPRGSDGKNGEEHG
jgi:hypothetical protein